MKVRLFYCLPMVEDYLGRLKQKRSLYRTFVVSIALVTGDDVLIFSRLNVRQEDLDSGMKTTLILREARRRERRPIDGWGDGGEFDVEETKGDICIEVPQDSNLLDVLGC